MSTLKARGAPTVLAALSDSDGHMWQSLGTDTHLKVSGFEKAQGPPGTTPPLSEQDMEAWWGQGWEGYTRVISLLSAGFSGPNLFLHFVADFINQRPQSTMCQKLPQLRASRWGLGEGWGAGRKEESERN